VTGTFYTKVGISATNETEKISGCLGMKRNKKILEWCCGVNMFKFEADNLHLNHAKKPSLLLAFQQLHYGPHEKV
jgi:hypothetical protein